MPVEQLAALITAVHGANQAQLPVSIVAAGLPQLLGQTGRAKSYAEGFFEFVSIDKLGKEAAIAALRPPADSARVTLADARSCRRLNGLRDSHARHVSLVKLLKVALDELRMQMLGVQVLFGFEFQALFQDGFIDASPVARGLAIFALLATAAALGVLVAVPCQHRISEGGEASERLRRVATRASELALLLIAGAIGLDFFVTTSRALSTSSAALLAALIVGLCLGAWYGLGWIVRIRYRTPNGGAVANPSTSLHDRIDQMLTEARVILPGAQALLGFQLIVMMTKTFGTLARTVQFLHVAALICIAVTVVMLIAPAAIHRIAFDGRDDEHFHRLGSALITLALGPFALGIACDLFVAMTRVFESGTARAIAASSLGLLLLLWYVLPLALRPAAQAGLNTRTPGTNE